MKEVLIVRRTQITVDGKSRVQEYKYQGYLDGESLRLTRCVGKSFPCAAPVRQERSSHMESAAA